MSSLSIVIPAYNEEEALKDFLPEVLSFCKEHGYQLIVTNDSSTDGTRAILDAVEEPEIFTPIHHKVNRGYGGALKTGIRAATTDYVITIDADGQHVLEDVARLHRLIDESDADMIVGNRDRNPQSLYRQFGKGLIRWLAKLLMPLPVRDINSGIKICHTELSKRYLNFCPDSMAYSDTITLVFVAQRHLVLEEPVSLRPRIGGVSTITAKVALVTVLELIHIVVLLNPMRVFLPLAVFFVLFGGIWNIPIFLRGEGVSTGAMMLIVSGLIFFLLGLITALLSNIRLHQANS